MGSQRYIQKLGASRVVVDQMMYFKVLEIKKLCSERQASETVANALGIIRMKLLILQNVKVH